MGGFVSDLVWFLQEKWNFFSAQKSTVFCQFPHLHTLKSPLVICLLHSSPFPCIKSPILHLLILSLSLFICECKAAFIHGYHREKSSLCHTSCSHQQHIQSTARTHAHTDVCVYLWPHGYSQHGAGMSGRQLSSQTKELKMLQGLLSAVRARYM